MASPKVFISSTCFDLKEIRDSLSRFVKAFGFDPVLSEHGDVFYHPDLHTHDACIHEISNCQIFILIIGGRFGGTYVHDKDKSITNAEYEAALECNLPIFTYIKKDVLDNHHLYTANKDKPFVSEFEFTAIEKQNNCVDIFNFIDCVRKASINNAFEGFETSHGMEEHLRKQWAGMFFDFLKNREVKEQLSVAKVMLSTLQTSSEKAEELLKGLYKITDTSDTNEFLEDVDIKYAAIQFFEFSLNTLGNSSNAYLGYSEDLDRMVAVDPNEFTWYEYLVELGCFEAVNVHDENGDEEKSIDFCGIGNANFSGFCIDDAKYHKEKKEFYETGVKRISLDQRKEIIVKFLKPSDLDKGFSTDE